MVHVLGDGIPALVPDTVVLGIQVVQKLQNACQQNTYVIPTFSQCNDCSVEIVLQVSFPSFCQISIIILEATHWLKRKR